MDITLEKRGYLLDDYRLFHLNEAQNESIGFHYHEFCKVFLLCSGSGDYTVDAQRYALEAGDVVLIDSRCIHRPEFPASHPYDRIIIYISPSFLNRFSTPDCNLLQIFNGQWGRVLRPDDSQKEQIFHTAKKLEQELGTVGFGQSILSRVRLLQLLIEIARGFETAGNCLPDNRSAVSGRVLDIQRYLDAHLTEDITIDHLAEVFYISKYHMMRSFQREIGQSIHVYINNRRLQLAREYIDRGHSATESCFLAGFRSYSSFTRAYNRHFGTTPTGRRDQSIRREHTFE